MIQPTKGNVYVTRTQLEEKKTESGIIIPKTAAENDMMKRLLIYGKVKAVGDEVTKVKIGDECIFPRYEGWPLNADRGQDDKEFLVDEKFIIGTVVHTP